MVSTSDFYGGSSASELHSSGFHCRGDSKGSELRRRFLIEQAGYAGVPSKEQADPVAASGAVLRASAATPAAAAAASSETSSTSNRPHSGPGGKRVGTSGCQATQ